jgi:hypothetical protein
MREQSSFFYLMQMTLVLLNKMTIIFLLFMRNQSIIETVKSEILTLARAPQLVLWLVCGG